MNEVQTIIEKVNKLIAQGVLDPATAGKFDVYSLPDKEYIDKHPAKDISIEKLLNDLKKIDSVYLHFGYCPSLCKVCPYPKMANKKSVEDLLVKDLSLNLKFVTGRKIKSVLFGGGTPNTMDIETFKDTIKLLNRFNLSEFEQIAIEIHPGLEYKKYIDVLIDNFDSEKIHVSLGLQSTIDEKIKFWRAAENEKPFLYTNQQVNEIIKDLISNRITQINVDILLASFDDWEKEKSGLEKLINLGVNKFTIYPVYGKYMQGQTIQKWNIEELIKIRYDSRDFFEKYNVINSINPNYFSSKDTTDNLESISQFKGETLLAVGLGSRGKIRFPDKDVIYENFRDPKKYKKLLEKNNLPIHKIYQQVDNLVVSNEIRELVFKNSKVSHDTYKKICKLAGKNKILIEMMFKELFLEKEDYHILSKEGGYVVEMIQASIFNLIEKNITV